MRHVRPTLLLPSLISTAIHGLLFTLAQLPTILGIMFTASGVVLCDMGMGRIIRRGLLPARGGSDGRAPWHPAPVPAQGFPLHPSLACPGVKDWR
jgi:hypothetical protein